MPNCIKLELAEPYHFAPCAVSEPADFRGMRINAIYDDGSRSTVEVTQKMFNEPNLHTPGASRRCTVTFDKQKLFVEVPLKSCTLEKILVETLPGFVAREGEPLDRSQLSVTAFYTDGSSKVVTNYKTEPHDSLSLDTDEVVIRYGRCKAFLDVEVQPSQISQTVPSKTIVAVSVARRPYKTKYLVGDTIADLSGGRLDLIYNDGTVGQIDMVADSDAAIEGSKEGPGMVSFSCFGKPVKYSIDLLTPKIVSLDIVKMPTKVTYIEGDELDLSGLILEASYNDGSTRTVKGLQSSGVYLSMSNNEDGVTIGYENIPFTIPVSVERVKHTEPVGLAIGKPPDKTTYIEREATVPDLTGLEAFLQLGDGKREPVVVNTASFDISHPGNTSLNLVYDSFTASVPIRVIQRSFVKIEVPFGLKQTTYDEDEVYNLQGFTVFACYDNAEKEIVTDYTLEKLHNGTCTGENVLKAEYGDTALVAKYLDSEVTVEVTVLPVRVSALSWITEPKTEYGLHESLDCANGLLLAVKNGSGSVVPLSSDMVSGFDSSKSGAQTLTVTYRNANLLYNVSVKSLRAVKLEVSNPRLNYTVGEVFDASGMTCIATYEDGSTAEVTPLFSDAPLSKFSKIFPLYYEDVSVVLNLNIQDGEPVSEKTSEKIPEQTFEKTCEKIPEPTFEGPSEFVSERKTETASDAVSEFSADVLNSTEPEKAASSESMSEMVLENRMEKAAKWMPEGLSEDVPELVLEASEAASGLADRVGEEQKWETSRVADCTDHNYDEEEVYDGGYGEYEKERKEKPFPEWYKPFYPSSFTLRFRDI